MSLKDSSTALWTAIKTKLDAALQAEQSGTLFYEWPVFHARGVGRAVVVVERTVRLEGAAVKLGTGELSVIFGCMVQSGADKGWEEAETVGYWLAQLFLEDPFLDEKARDVRLEGIDLTPLPPEPVAAGMPQGTMQHWALVHLVWSFDVARV